MNILEQTYQLGGAEYRAVIDSNGGYSIFRDGVFAGEVTPCRSCREDMQYEVSLPSGEVVGSFYCDDCEGIYPDDAGCQILHEYAVNPPGSIPWTMDNK